MDYVYGHTSMSQNNKIEVMEGDIIYIWLLYNKTGWEWNCSQCETDMQKR